MLDRAAALDTFREVVTPEGVALHLPVAGPVPRALAWALDAAIRAAVLIVAAIALGFAGAAGVGVYLTLLFVLMWGYPMFFEVLFDGRSPGKRALGLQVVAADGAPVGWLASFTRNLLRTVDMLPILYVAGFASCLADPGARRIGDLVAGTLVIHRLPEQSTSAAPLVAPQPPPLALQPDEQAAVVAFAERAPQLGDARRDELADLASQLAGARGERASMRLYAIAGWLLGRSA